MGQSNRTISISLRLYRTLANAFPYEFKNIYADELVQVTEDAIELIWRRHGAAGLARLLADIAFRKRVNSPVAHYWKFRDGKVARYTGFLDTAAVVEGLKP